jgi:hypothetical protein
MKLTKTKWFKAISMLVTLLFCMSVFALPAYASDGGWEEETQPESEEAWEEANEETWDEPEDGSIFGEPPELEEPFNMDGSGFRPFTPPGTGTVIDNALDSDGKEFYTIGTEDGSVFYLIIDRHRSGENVYFLNAVTEQDLISLAAKNGRAITGTPVELPPTVPQGENGQDPSETPEPETNPPKKSNAVVILIILAVAGGGGAVYYFKFVKGKKDADDDIYDGNNGEGDDDYEYDGEPDNGGLEPGEDGEDE